MKQKLITLRKYLRKNLATLGPKTVGVLVIGAIIVLALIFRDISNRGKIGVFMEEQKIHQKGVATALRSADSLHKLIVINEGRARMALDSVAKLDALLEVSKYQGAIRTGQLTQLKISLANATTIRDTVDRQTTIIAKQDTIIAKKNTTIGIQKTQIGLLKITILEKDTSITQLTAANTILSNSLKTTPILKHDPNKFLGIIPLPSRTTSAILGFVAGVVVVGTITR